MKKLRSKIAAACSIVLMLTFMATVTVSAAQANMVTNALAGARERAVATVSLTNLSNGEEVEVDISELELRVTPQAVSFGANGSMAMNIEMEATGYLYVDSAGMLRASGSKSETDQDGSYSGEITVTINYDHKTVNTRPYFKLTSVSAKFSIKDSSVVATSRTCNYGQMGRDENNVYHSSGIRGGTVSGTSYSANTNFDYYVFGYDELSACNSYAIQNMKRGTYEWSMEVFVSAF